MKSKNHSEHDKRIEVIKQRVAIMNDADIVTRESIMFSVLPVYVITKFIFNEENDTIDHTGYILDEENPWVAHYPSENIDDAIYDKITALYIEEGRKPLVLVTRDQQVFTDMGCPLSLTNISFDELLVTLSDRKSLAQEKELTLK